MPKRDDISDIAFAIPVARVEIIMYENGMVKVEGQITNLDFALSMLDTARDTVKNYHARNKLGKGGSVLIPSHDTPLGA